jgi:hypothetical protein
VRDEPQVRAVVAFAQVTAAFHQQLHVRSGQPSKNIPTQFGVRNGFVQHQTAHLFQRLDHSAARFLGGAQNLLPPLTRFVVHAGNQLVLHLDQGGSQET